MGGKTTVAANQQNEVDRDGLDIDQRKINLTRDYQEIWCPKCRRTTRHKGRVCLVCGWKRLAYWHR